MDNTKHACNTTPPGNRIDVMRQTIDYAFANGIAVTLPKRGRKGHHEKHWPDQVMTDWEAVNANGDLADYNPALTFVYGASNNFSELDLDCEIAKRTLPFAGLPTSTMIWGRPSNPWSHHGFRTSDQVEYKAFRDANNAILIERRTGNRYTLGPGAIHDEDDEVYVWDSGGPPLSIDADEYTQKTNFHGAMTMIASAWPEEGGRNFATQHLAGALAHGGMKLDDAIRFVRGVCAGALDEEVEARVTFVRNTYEKHQRDEPVTGKRSLMDTLDRKLVRRVFMDLGLTRSSRPLNLSDLEASDYGNGWLLIERHSDVLLFDPANKRWCVWDGTRWKPDDMARVNELMADTAGAYANTAVTFSTREARQDGLKRAIAMMNKNKSQAAIWAAGHQFNDLKVDTNEFDTDPHLVNVQNGTVDLRTGELLPHTRTDFITKVGGAMYVKNAPFSESTKFLLSIMDDDQEKVDYLQRLVGYCMLGEQVDHVFPVFYGSGRNGKDTLYKILRALFGDYAIRTTAATFLKKHDADRASPEIVALRGVRLAYGSETEHGQELAEAKIKDLTGGGEIAGRNLFESNQEWVPTHTLILSTNHRPIIKGRDPAIWLRVHLVPFLIRFVDDPDEATGERKRIPKLADTLIATELSGWLNWAIDGYDAWQRNGLKPPESIIAATQQYQDDMDLLGGFLAAECDVGPGLKAHQRDLWARYDDWRRDNDEEGFGTLKSFKAALTERGFSVVKGERLVTWSGVKLKGDDDSPAGSLVPKDDVGLDPMNSS